jgi:hypothetical protein
LAAADRAAALARTDARADARVDPRADARAPADACALAAGDGAAYAARPAGPTPTIVVATIVAITPVAAATRRAIGAGVTLAA